MHHSTQDEIDFLMEEEYALQSRLDRIHERLEVLLSREVVVELPVTPAPPEPVSADPAPDNVVPLFRVLSPVPGGAA